MNFSFKLWLENAQVSINDAPFKAQLKKQAEKDIEMVRDLAAEAEQFDPQKFLQTIRQEYANYPQLNNLLNALNSKNIHYIFDQQSKLRQWLTTQPYQKQSRDISRQIYTYIDTFRKSDTQKAEQEVWRQVQAAVEATVVKMNELKQIIDNAISRIGHWNGSQVIIAPLTSQNEYNRVALEPADNAEITLGTQEFAPQFTIFRNEGQIEIDDVLEGGDTDFFHNHEIQSDYFNLINEMRKPGSTNKGKVVTLYTARPKKDRQQLLDAKTLPVNIFLTNDYDHAEGIGRDMGDRDIWKVRMDNRYLTKTLDGKIQYYQVTVPNAPVMSMDLL